MKNTKILEMINNNQLEELKKLLQDEIYIDTLNSNSNAKKRYSAMKKYFVEKINNKACMMPCKDITVNGCIYNSFVDGVSIVLTTENTGKMETFDNSRNDYLKVDGMVTSLYQNSFSLINVNQILADASKQGYKYSAKQCITGNAEHIVKIGNGYFNIALLEKAYKIIDNNSICECYVSNSDKNPILIQNEIGVIVVLPIYVQSGSENKFVITESGIEL